MTTVGVDEAGEEEEEEEEVVEGGVGEITTISTAIKMNKRR
jgi:hypothetical protein